MRALQVGLSSGGGLRDGGGGLRWRRGHVFLFPHVFLFLVRRAASPRRRRRSRPRVYAWQLRDIIPIRRRQPEFFAGGPYRWYVAAVGAYFYCQLAVNFVVFVTYVDTRCKHHNILVVNRVDYTGLDFCALAGVEADASCGYGSATSPACDAGAQSLRPLRWAKKGAAFQAPTAWLGDCPPGFEGKSPPPPSPAEPVLGRRPARRSLYSSARSAS